MQRQKDESDWLLDGMKTTVEPKDTFWSTLFFIFSANFFN